jgi:hypothetical protein
VLRIYPLGLRQSRKFPRRSGLVPDQKTIMKLRPYQQEVAKAVIDSIRNSKGLTFSVEIARQGGKNELSAHLEVLLLTLYMARGHLRT